MKGLRRWSRRPRSTKRKMNKRGRRWRRNRLKGESQDTEQKIIDTMIYSNGIGSEREADFGVEESKFDVFKNKEEPESFLSFRFQRYEEFVDGVKGSDGGFINSNLEEVVDDHEVDSLSGSSSDDEFYDPPYDFPVLEDSDGSLCEAASLRVDDKEDSKARKGDDHCGEKDEFHIPNDAKFFADEDLIEQLRMEIGKVKAIGLSTIFEDSEPPKMAQDMKLFEKLFCTTGTMDEVQKFYKSYRERMRKFDIFNYQKMYAIDCSYLFLGANISAGASGALFGLLGAMLSELITKWSTYTNKRMLIEFESMCGVTVLRIWSPAVTHVLATTDEFGPQPSLKQNSSFVEHENLRIYSNASSC